MFTLLACTLLLLYCCILLCTCQTLFWTCLEGISIIAEVELKLKNASRKQYSLHIKWSFIQQMWQNLQKAADLVTFTEEILYGKLHFMCNVFNECWYVQTNQPKISHSKISQWINQWRTCDRNDKGIWSVDKTRKYVFFLKKDIH